MSTAPPVPSVLYSDHSGVEGGLFLWGELPIADDLDTIREIVLRWRGVLAELRPRERAAVESQIAALTERLTAASTLLEMIDQTFDDLRDERNAKHEREGDDGNDDDE